MLKRQKDKEEEHRRQKLKVDVILVGPSLPMALTAGLSQNRAL